MLSQSDVMFCLQTKGVRGVATIEVNTAAWIAAAAAGGAAVIGTAILWPVMKRVLRKYDERASALPKDASGGRGGRY